MTHTHKQQFISKLFLSLQMKDGYITVNVMKINLNMEKRLCFLIGGVKERILIIAVLFNNKKILFVEKIVSLNNQKKKQVYQDIDYG